MESIKHAIEHFKTMSDEDIRICDTCGEQTDINVCWTDSGDYWCGDECVPQWKWKQMFAEEQD